MNDNTQQFPEIIVSQNQIFSDCMISEIIHQTGDTWVIEDAKTPSNEELLKLAKNNPPPPCWYNEEYD